MSSGLSSIAFVYSEIEGAAENVVKVGYTGSVSNKGMMMNSFMVSPLKPVNFWQRIVMSVYRIYLCPKSTYLANILSFVTQNLTQHVHWQS